MREIAASMSVSVAHQEMQPSLYLVAMIGFAAGSTSY